ncbi:MAG: HEPN domain-containing protein [Thiotrichaceae bacterium]|nr:HEPN domain-containing protein [Thiotrichaceae bacterium]
MAKAKRATASAKILLDDGDIDGACNRAYYGMFDAAHAALLAVGDPVNPANTKTHRGLIGAFGQYLIKPGLLKIELGRLFNQVEQIRLIADYMGEEVDFDKGKWAVEKAEFLVLEVEKFLLKDIVG